MVNIKAEPMEEEARPKSSHIQSALRQMKSTEPKKPLIVIAVDFGTTFSGVAHTFLTADRSTCNSEEILVLNDWPARSSDKVPTRFAYVQSEEPVAKRARTAKSPSSSTSPPVFKWGFNVDAQDNVIEYIKLVLSNNAELPAHTNRRKIEAELSKHGRDAETAAVQYFEALLKCIEIDLGRRYGQSRVNGTDRRFVLTVPAIWTDAEKDFTKKIAILAGFPEDLLLVSEPEAAAIWTILCTPYLQPKVGDTYIVCDAGGGTVDLISYEITQLDPLRLKEAVIGKGGLCGGSYINEKFEEHIRAKIGVIDFENFKKEHLEARQDAMANFENNIKRSFDPGRMPSRTYFVGCSGIPDNSKAGIQKSRIALSTDEMKNIFEPVVNEVINLTEHQVNAVRQGRGKPAGILLVGGFGESAWLLDRIQSNFTHQGIETVRPPSSWSAVARGAVLWAIQGSDLIQSRKARVWYGVSCDPVFEPQEHPSKSRYWDDLHETYRSSDRFDLLISRDQTVFVRQAASVSLIEDFLENEDRRSTSWLFTSSSLGKPKDTISRPISRLCRLESNLNLVPQHHFKRNVNSSGSIFHTLEFELKIQLESGGLRFWLEVGGIEYAAITADFI